MDKLISSDLEAAVLGCILLENECFETAKELNLRTSDFHFENTKIVYEAMKVLYNQNSEIDSVTIVETLKEGGNLENVGGVSFVCSLPTIVPTTTHMGEYVKRLKVLSNKRLILAEMQRITQNISNLSLEELEKEAENLKDLSSDTGRFDNKFTCADKIDEVKKVKSLSTGFNKLDRALHGLEYGTLTVLTGEPSTGKSTLLNQIIANTLANNESVFLYSGELPQKKLLSWFKRTVAEPEDIQEYVDEYGSAQYGLDIKASDAIKKWSKNLCILNDDEKPSESNLIGTIKYLVKEKNIRLVVLDNLMTMITDDPGSDEYKKQKYLVNNLKKLAKKYELVIILVAHANKKSAENRIPNMFDVSGAAEIVNLADYVLKAIREIKRDDETNQIISDESCLWIAKNRIEGIQNVPMRMFFDSVRKRFYTDGTELRKDYGYKSKYTQVEIEDPF